MKRILNISLLSLLIALIGVADVSAQGKGKKGGSWDSNRTLHLSGSPNIQLELEPGLMDSEATDEDGSTQLVWGRGNSKSKITVSTFAPGQQFELEVEATDVDNAKSVGKIKLRDGMQDRNLLVNVKKNKIGSARLVYTASASIENGSSDSGSTDVHTVTYTVTDM